MSQRRGGEFIASSSAFQGKVIKVKGEAQMILKPPSVTEETKGDLRL